jgi:hypothetical protein
LREVVSNFRSLRGDIVSEALSARPSPAAKIPFQTRTGDGGMHGERGMASLAWRAEGEAKMSGPTPVKVVTVTIDRVTYGGTYFAQNYMVHVVSSFGAKATRFGKSKPEVMAQLVLLELLREGGKT